jgi:hypothetical protein
VVNVNIGGMAIVKVGVNVSKGVAGIIGVVVVDGKEVSVVVLAIGLIAEEIAAGVKFLGVEHPTEKERKNIIIKRGIFFITLPF